MARAYVIDPRTRTINEIEQPPIPGDQMVARVDGVGFVIATPMSVMDPGIHPFYFEPMGLMLGRVLVAEPQCPLPTLQRQVTWIRSLMVINDATLIIPYRRTADA